MMNNQKVSQTVILNHCINTLESMITVSLVNSGVEPNPWKT